MLSLRVVTDDANYMTLADLFVGMNPLKKLVKLQRYSNVSKSFQISSSHLPFLLQVFVFLDDRQQNYSNEQNLSEPPVDG